MSNERWGFGKDRRFGIRDCRLVERALRERWPIPVALRPRLVDRLAEIASAPTSSPRTVLSAARALLEVSEANLSELAMASKLNEHVHLRARIKAIDEEARGGAIRLAETPDLADDETAGWS